eukprot:NODE_738_length_1224_cov_82.678213_g698_i0.p2 GENE.NODE_738_length_1224_cov_82.678213_g698_i0~~NODE_738_length_1224_cov_82.678213_g698_i0.p2  ORF type:complete len:323 (-),score=84.58 NODE_738_length_1224_cov_82.678213_g698_i0:103-1071(-)
MVQPGQQKAAAPAQAGNMFAALSKKSAKGDPLRTAQKATQRQQPKKEGEHPAPVDKGPKKKSRSITLGDMAADAPAAPAPQPEARETKKEREVKDHHVDRSGKRDRERKGGKGQGGWEDTNDKVVGQQEEEAVAADVAKDEKEAGDEAEKPQEAAEPEPETVSYEEWKAKQSKTKKADFNVRQVDQAQFKQMKQVKRAEETYLTLPKEQQKKAPAPAPKQGKAKSKAKEAPAPKPEPKKKEHHKEKVDSSELGFRMESGSGRGRGRGRGREGEGSPRGRGGYRGRGSAYSNAPREQQLDINSAELFPALGSSGGAPAAEPAQ